MSKIYKRIYILVNALLWGLTGWLFLLTNKPILLDDMILLESRHPFYWEDFGMLYAGEDVIVFPQYQNLNADQIEDKLPGILKDFAVPYRNLAGVEIVQEDDTLILSGIATETIWPSMTLDMLNLSSGLYYISLGFDHKGVICCLNEYDSVGHCVTLTNDLGNSIVKVDGTNKYNIAMMIPNEMSLHYIRISPRIIKLSDADVYNSFIVKAWHITMSNWERYSEKEKDMALRNLQLSQNAPSWSSIIFDDGVGIQYNGEVFLQGDINCFGVVYGANQEHDEHM